MARSFTWLVVLAAVLLPPQQQQQVDAFAVIPSSTTSSTSTSTSTTTSLWMGGSSGYATSLAGKKARVEKLKELLETSQMIFTIPGDKLTVKQSEKLRRSMPEGTTMTTVKNTLMERAIDQTDFAPATALLTGSHTWFFIQEDISGTITALNAFVKELKKEETHPILGGVIEGTLYDKKGVDAIGKLPTKKELYAKIAWSIKAVPTKVARVIKEPGNKLARAIRLATMPDETASGSDEADAAAEPPAE